MERYIKYKLEEKYVYTGTEYAYVDEYGKKIMNLWKTGKFDDIEDVINIVNDKERIVTAHLDEYLIAELIQKRFK